MEYLANFGLFLAQTFTLVAAILLTALGLAAIFLKDKDKDKSKLTIKVLNKKFHRMKAALSKKVLSKKAYRHFVKESKALQKKRQHEPHNNIYVLEFHGDIRAQAVETLRNEITAILSIATKKDEIVILIDSPGGLVHTYGLAASQLQRIRNHKIPLTVCVDKVAASGGYLMACVGDKIIAAPFAIIGSIGVKSQIPNFNRLLKKNNIDVEQITAGEFKTTLTMFGENTDKARKKFKEDLELIHDQFKEFVSKHRPQVDIKKIATGEYWLADRAFELAMVDQLNTSDDYLLEASKKANIYHVAYAAKKTLVQKITGSCQQFLHDFAARMVL